MKINLSLVIPVHNESEILEKNTRIFINYFRNCKSVSLFEIIITDNGSQDTTPLVARRLADEYPNVSFYSLKRRGLGLAIAQGITKAKYPYIYVNAIDNPFDFKDFVQFLDKIKSSDLVFASKNHPQSLYQGSFVRIAASKIMSVLIRILFSLSLTDTQGTIFGKKTAFNDLLPYCTSSGAFFQAQIAINAVRRGMKICEVPVQYVFHGKKSKFRLVRDYLKFMFELFREKAQISHS